MQALHDFRGPDSVVELTARQAQVLELVAKRCTLKQIASLLSISESAVNQHIKALKSVLGVNSLTELAEVHRALLNVEAGETCRKTACRISGLSQPDQIGEQPDSEGLGPIVSFHDALSYRLGTPWEDANEPEVVPGVLNGTNAKLVRATLIVALALGLFILVLVGLGVAQGISQAIPRKAVPSNGLTPAR